MSLIGCGESSQDAQPIKNPSPPSFSKSSPSPHSVSSKNIESPRNPPLDEPNVIEIIYNLQNYYDLLYGISPNYDLYQNTKAYLLALQAISELETRLFDWSQENQFEVGSLCHIWDKKISGVVLELYSLILRLKNDVVRDQRERVFLLSRFTIGLLLLRLQYSFLNFSQMNCGPKSTLFTLLNKTLSRTFNQLSLYSMQIFGVPSMEEQSQLLYLLEGLKKGEANQYTNILLTLGGFDRKIFTSLGWGSVKFNQIIRRKQLHKKISRRREIVDIAPYRLDKLESLFLYGVQYGELKPDYISELSPFKNEKGLIKNRDFFQVTQAFIDDFLKSPEDTPGIYLFALKSYFEGVEIYSQGIINRLKMDVALKIPQNFEENIEQASIIYDSISAQSFQLYSIWKLKGSDKTPSPSK